LHLGDTRQQRLKLTEKRIIIAFLQFIGCSSIDALTILVGEALVVMFITATLTAIGVAVIPSAGLVLQ